MAADHEQRISALERELASVKARMATYDEDMRNIPDLIKTEFRFTNSQIARLSRDVSELRDLPGKFEALARQFDALPRAVAELVLEMLAERDRGS